MAEQAYRLLRIIIIDSFWQGQVNELNLQGHTQLEGTNGAGKTSLMRILPLFYGMRPSDIVSKVDQAKNFVDYYLPRSSSMLIFEYQRPYGQKCMVLASSDGRSIHYKLIDAAYDAAIFVNDEGHVHSATEVERAYKKLGIFCSKFLAVEKYRQVIQNLSSGRKVKDIRQLQQRFSFSDRPCPHIDKVVNGTIEKSLDFDAIKQMLVAISSDHLARNMGDENEQIALNKEDISRWLADMKASLEVKKGGAQIEAWQNDFAQLKQLLSKLTHLHSQLNTHLEALANKQQDFREQRQAAKEQLKHLQNQLETQQQALQEKIYKLKAQIDADQAHIDRLDEDKQRFEADDAANYKIRAQEAESLQEQLQEVIAIINSFEGDISKIADKFDGLLSDLKLQQVSFEASNQQQQAQIKEASNAELNEVASAYQNQLNILNEHLNQQYIDLVNNKHSLDSKRSYLQKSLAEPSIPAELLSALEEKQSKLNEYQQVQTQLLIENNDLLQGLSQLEKQREQALYKHAQESRQLEKLRQQYIEVEQQLLPDEDSLHYFLDQEQAAAGWKQNIGRVLSPQILTRTDLEPRFTQIHHSIYGLEINLQNLEESNALLGSESELRDKAQVLEQQKLSQTEVLAQLDEHIAQLNKQIKAEQGRIFEHKQALQAADLELQQSKTEYERLQLKKQQARNEISKQIEEELQELEKQIAVCKQALVEFSESKKQQLHELHNQSLEKRLVIESDRDSQLELLQEQAENYAQDLANRKKDYKKQKRTALEKLDPDGEVDKRSAEKKRLEEALKLCAVYAQKARDYDGFLANSYCHRDKLADANQERQIELQSLKTSSQKLEQSLKQQITELKAKHKKLSAQYQHNDELIIQLEQSRKLCEVNGIDAKADDKQGSTQADIALSFCNDFLSQFTAQEKRLNKALSAFNDKLRQRHSSSQLYDNWQKLLADNDHFQGAEQIFKYQHAIADLLSSADQLHKVTGQSVIVNANMINEFYHHIENFARRIRQIGKQLSSKVTALVHFKALADINVRTVMKQEELDYWGPLQQFSRVFDHCREQLREGFDEIDTELLESMSRLAQYLPSEGLRLEHHKLFDIEFEITEKGQLKFARNARQLKSISSTGLSYLAMLSLFAGILQMLRSESAAASNIILPVDELGELAAENIDLLLQMFKDCHIQILSASPSTDRHVLALYDKHYKLKDKRIYTAVLPTSKLEALLAAAKGKQEPVAEPENPKETVEQGEANEL